MNLRYLSGAILSVPLLPLMYYQGKKIRASVPRLPEATGVTGQCLVNGNPAGELKVISIGESTIAGVGVDTHKEGFTGTLAAELSELMNVNVSWKVYARSGYTARRVATSIIPKITEEEADLVVIGLGGNDAFTLNRPSKWQAEVRTLIEKLREKYPRAVIIFCNMPPIKEFPAFTPLIKFTLGNLVEILGDALEEVVKGYENTFYFGEKITLRHWIHKFEPGATKDDFFSDGVHPSKLTYQTWAKDIASKISKDKVIRSKLPVK
jgi:lysophospholipase L1-like esterase